MGHFARNPEALNAASEECDQAGGQAVIFVVDVALEALVLALAGAVAVAKSKA